MKLVGYGKWFASWYFGEQGIAVIFTDLATWKLGVEFHPRNSPWGGDPLGKRVSIEVQVGPVIVGVTW